jgi:ABC-type multidrug transport system fused ATPase/permease subunit
MIKQLSILLITVLSVSSTAVRASEAAETADAIAAVAAFEAAKATEAENAVAAFRELEAMADICLTGALEHLEANPWQLSQEHVEDLRTMLLAKLEPVAQQIVQEQVAQEPAVKGKSHLLAKIAAPAAVLAAFAGIAYYNGWMTPETVTAVQSWLNTTLANAANATSSVREGFMNFNATEFLTNMTSAAREKLPTFNSTAILEKVTPSFDALRAIFNRTAA